MAEFRELLEAQIPRMRRYAIALTRNEDRADDLVHDALVRALAKQHLWEPGTDLRAWLFTILHNLRVNDVRRGVREGTAVDIEHMPEVAAPTDPSARLTLTELDRAIGRIPEDQRQVILLVGLEGMSYEDAAAVVGVPVGTVRSRLSRGRDALRAAMGMERPAERRQPLAA
jgi:RNA polymerase sigma-70 factor, ECF subfamily